VVAFGLKINREKPVILRDFGPGSGAPQLGGKTAYHSVPDVPKLSMTPD
jgi:hypothetical protein